MGMVLLWTEGSTAVQTGTAEAGSMLPLSNNA